MERSQRRREMITVGLFLIYAVFLSWIILFKMCLPGDVLPHLRNLNLIPFAGALVVNGKADYTEVVQNLIAFIPFGVYMSVMKPGAPFLKKLLPAACVSLAYEALQYALALGATDITDLISNTAEPLPESVSTGYLPLSAKRRHTGSSIYSQVRQPPAPCSF